MILSVDQGTTHTKALLVGCDGRVAHRYSGAAMALQYPQPGFVECDAEALWESALEGIQACVKAAREAEIEGVAIANQRETALVWDRKTGRALSPAMSWQCRRSSELCERRSDVAKEFRERCGLPLDPLVSASKWAWVLERNSGLAARARRGEICLGTVDSWLIWKLTGGAVHATDHTNASRTGLLNLETLCWDEPLLELFGVPEGALPQLLASSSVYGRCSGVENLEGVPLVAAIGDSHAAMVGHGGAVGVVKATYGTGSSLMTVTEALHKTDGRLASTVAWSSAGGVRYALEGNITMAGAAVQWVGEFLGLAQPVAETLALAATTKETGGVVFVPAMTGLAAPWWNTAARGCIVGLEARSTRAHLARAALEAIGFQVRDVFCAMQEAGKIELPELRADGGATRNGELMQWQADVLGRPVLRSACEDLSALGAAWLGGLTMGWWGSDAEFSRLGEEAVRFEPRMLAAERQTRLRAWERAVQSALQAAPVPVGCVGAQEQAV